MVFGAELVLLGFDVFFAVFFAVLFFLAVFFAVLFLAGADLFVVEVLGVELWPCACATYGTVDAPTNASRANAEINAFILWYS
ncbi:MAG TPA: hypothetical protein VN728_14075 [Stellaceae bacterium]|jgi:hypothetical protein|nr:hypothetical protein [Stellaceae bacterium]